MPCQSLNFPEIFILKRHYFNELYVVNHYQNHPGIVALSISPFLVIDDNIQIKASTNDNKIEIHHRFEKYVISKSDTSILHHAFISIFIALWAVITHYVSILMGILSYFTRFIMKRGNAYWKYALEAIIKWLLLCFLVHDNCLLFML